MRILTGQEEVESARWMEEARQEALKSTCERARCGTVIVSHGTVIGRGYNSPPQELESQRRCLADKGTYNQKVTDKTCCIHAEQRAMDDSLRRNPLGVTGSTLYFTRVDAKGRDLRSGDPYCTLCSKRALDLGIEKFVLWRPEGICVYGTEEYNDLSFAYRGG